MPRQIIWVAGASLVISAVIALALAHQRVGIEPFEIPVYRHLILFQDYYVVFPFIAIIVAALLSPVRALGVHAALFCGRHVWWVAGLTTAALAIGAHWVYHIHPLSLDEYAVLFQSRIFAEGRLTGQYPPELIDWLIPAFFQGRFIKPSYDTGAVVSIYWPGFSLLLAPFTALGMSWLLNPLIGGATVIVMHRIALALFGKVESAGYVVLLTLASPAVTLHALSYYSMSAHLLANALFMLLLLRPAPIRAFAAGLVGSVALVLHNPVPHLLFAVPWIVWLAFQPGRVKIIGALVAGYLPVCLVIGWGWAIYLQSFGSSMAVGDLATPKGAAETLIYRLGTVLGWTSSTGVSTHVLDLCKLWLWAAPALLTVAVLGARHLREDRGVWLVMAGCALLTYFGYFVVRFDQGHGWGFRYFHSAWLVLPLFAARALALPGREQLAGYLAGCALLSLIVLTGFRALQAEQFVARHLSQLPAAASGEARVRIVNLENGYYAWDLIQNDPFLRGTIIFRSRGAQADAALMAARFPQYERLSEDRRGSVWGTRTR
jgi:hypothetical protein